MQLHCGCRKLYQRSGSHMDDRHLYRAVLYYGLGYFVIHHTQLRIASIIPPHIVFRNRLKSPCFIAHHICILKKEKSFYIHWVYQ